MQRALAPLLVGLAVSALTIVPVRADEASDPQDASLAAESNAQVAQDLENPVYHRITIPLQNNFDCCYSTAGGYKITSNIEPVIPLARIAPDWELISRTIFPIIYEYRNKPGQGGDTGVGDITQAFYFSPISGKSYAYGFGPIFLLPAGDSQIGNGRWASGPTFAGSVKSGPFTTSIILWQYWSFAATGGNGPISKARVQPAIAYTFRDSTTLKFGTDADYDWTKHTWSAPVYTQVSRVYHGPLGTRVQLAIAAKIYTSTANGPQAGARFTATWTLPK